MENGTVDAVPFSVAAPRELRKTIPMGSNVFRNEQEREDVDEMVQRQVTILEDDLDGGEATETATLSLIHI